MRNIDARLKALERLGADDTWLVLECIERPTAEQLTELENAKATGRMGVLLIKRGDCLWMPGFKKPWEVGL